MAELTVLAPGRVEALAVGGSVVLTGTGRSNVTGAARRLGGAPAPTAGGARDAAAGGAGGAIAAVGVVTGIGAGSGPGRLVVATELWTLDGGPGRRTSGAALLAAELRRSGLDVICGPVVSVDGPLSPRDRQSLEDRGAVAVDGGSAWIADELASAPGTGPRDAATRGGPLPMAVIGSIGDFVGALDRPVGTERATRQARAIGPLIGVRPALERWSRALGPRRVLMAGPRSFCAGVERAIRIVEEALERYGAPVYVRRQIVHNSHVVADLESRGAVFVDELDQVPDAATVVLAAHGVSPAVRRQAEDRASLQVIDATCPLVSKVHHEARRFVSRGYDIALVGHAGHEEVDGTMGEAPDHIHLVETAEQVDRLAAVFASAAGEGARAGAGVPARPLAYLTQTTLATDEAGEVIEALRRRFPDVTGPSSADICYATQNRQDAVRAIAAECDLVLVVGSPNSSNTSRLVEVARREGVAAELVEDASELRLSWLEGVGTVGLTAGASAPESMVRQLVDALGSLGPLEVEERRAAEEHVRFTLPMQVR